MGEAAGDLDFKLSQGLRNLMSDPYVVAIESMRRSKDNTFARDPQSPIADKEGFHGLSYYPIALDLRIRTPLIRHETPTMLKMETSDGAARDYRHIGHFELVIDGAAISLQAYQQRGSEALFVPFRDATSGEETYGAGRYLDLHLEHGDEVDVDFNRAYHPYCAYSDAYSCPFPPPENWLKVAIRAGERTGG